MGRIKISATGRGFRIGEFVDEYGLACSIQESSLATKAAIWLGFSSPKVKVLVPGEGWREVDLKALLPGSDVQIDSRMHLTQGMAKALIPILQKFVETSYLPDVGAEFEIEEIPDDE